MSRGRKHLSTKRVFWGGSDKTRLRQAYGAAGFMGYIGPMYFLRRAAAS